MTLIDIGELSKPATVLVKKVSDAIGGVFKPWQIRRVAQAEAEADKIRAVSRIEITELEERALTRFIAEEARNQTNIESITAKALPQVEDDATPNEIEDDWIVNFFDKCRLISDDEMQLLWSSVLAGEANSPGTFSKRTVNFLGSLDKSDAEQFQTLCSFGWSFGNVALLIYDINDDIYAQHGVSFNSLQHLDEIGLISFDNLMGLRRIRLPQTIYVFYYGTPVCVSFDKPTDNQIQVGKAMLSKVGQELAPICGSKPVPDFLEYVLSQWVDKQHLHVWSPWPPAQAMKSNLPPD